jgi:hypothetical protein
VGSFQGAATTIALGSHLGLVKSGVLRDEGQAQMAAFLGDSDAL